MSSSKDEAGGSKPSVAEDKMSETKKSESAKALLAKIKTPPKPSGAPDIAAIVKKYTTQQADGLRKDLLKDLKAGQEAFANEMKAQFLGLSKVLSDSIVPRQDQLPPVAIPQILPVARPVAAPVSLMEDDAYEYESERDDDDEEDETLIDGVESKKFRSRTKPTDEVVRLWAQARRVTDDYAAEDWKKTPSNADVKTYTSHPAAKSFRAPAVDSEAPALKYKEQKDHEKKVSFFLINCIMNNSDNV